VKRGREKDRKKSGKHFRKQISKHHITGENKKLNN
jgi:hypothetical protein